MGSKGRTNEQIDATGTGGLADLAKSLAQSTTTGSTNMLAMDICANPTDGTQSWQPAGLTPGANSTRLSIMIQE
jgi:hypothetical protein